jgi:hypothetical protein
MAATVWVMRQARQRGASRRSTPGSEISRRPPRRLLCSDPRRRAKNAAMAGRGYPAAGPKRLAGTACIRLGRHVHIRSYTDRPSKRIGATSGDLSRQQQWVDMKAETFATSDVCAHTAVRRWMAWFDGVSRSCRTPASQRFPAQSQSWQIGGCRAASGTGHSCRAQHQQLP